MNVLIACEFSGVVREAFTKRGIPAWSCDLLPSLVPSPFHIQDDVTKVLSSPLDYTDNQIDHWDLMIAHPPCTYLAVSGARWLARKGRIIDANRYFEMKKAVQFFNMLLNADVDKIAVENPVPNYLWTKLPPHTQIVQPWMFGDPFEKRTCLWLKNLPELKPTKVVKPEPRVTFSSGKSMPAWYNLSPSKNRGLLRSVTFPGFAEAMAEQWS